MLSGLRILKPAPGFSVRHGRKTNGAVRFVASGELAGNGKVIGLGGTEFACDQLGRIRAITISP
jgi:hypothetical protein